jgi:pimeloyl-ACP methyl ester carboxylesterase
MPLKLILAFLALLFSFAAAASPVISYRSMNVDGVNVFYREAGSPSKPTIVLLHGFPSSSHMYENLMRDLAAEFHLLAPDYPGSGYTPVPDDAAFSPTFEGLTDVVERFVREKGLSRFAIYMQDFGGPVGFRLAMRHPDWVSALIVQNANAYEEGLSPRLVGYIQKMSAGVNAETQPLFENVLSPQSVRQMYLDGARNPENLNPDLWAVTQWSLQSDANRKVQMQLLADYHTNVAQYPLWQAYLRKHQPATLVVWGKNDSLFVEAGARAYAKDLPKARIRVLDAGHFALEEERAVIAREIRRFLKAGVPQARRRAR